MMRTRGAAVQGGLALFGLVPPTRPGSGSPRRRAAKPW